jgi:diguanylate cyclase (GGDEF)-like protein
MFKRVTKQAAEKHPLVRRLKKRIVRLEKMVYHDFLTDVLNRRGFLARAEKVFSRALYAQKNLNQGNSCQRFSILLIDVDYFKRVNDTYGHDTGDVVLRSVAQLLSERLRGYDIIGRWGGEEFIVLLAGITREASAVVAEDVRKQFEQSQMLYKKKKISVTVSIGISSFLKQKTLEQIICQADAAMYYAKQHGRNMVKVAK